MSSILKAKKICLGNQAIAVAFGGVVSHSPSGLLHEKKSLVYHDASGIFKGIPNLVVGGRYHSLAIEKLPDELEIIARTEDGIIMGIKHRKRLIFGLQFHPESVLWHQYVFSHMYIYPVPILLTPKYKLNATAVYTPK